MIRPAIETAASSLLLAGAAYLWCFGHLRHGIDPDAAEYLSVAALIGGLLVAADLWGGYPTWRRGFVALTASLLSCVGVEFVMVFGGGVIR